jgi:hypothetical protein
MMRHMTDALEGTSDPRARLASRLREWHIAAGAPSVRAVAAATGAGSHSTVAEILAGHRVSSWPRLESIVRYIGGDRAEAFALWTEVRAAAGPESEPEVAALGKAVRALVGLDRPAQMRVIAYLEDRFGGPAPEATEEKKP